MIPEKTRHVFNVADVPLLQDPTKSMQNSAMITNETCGSMQCSATLFSMAPHVPAGDGEIHPEIDELFYVISGQGILYLNGEPLRFQAGDVCFVPMGHHHSVENDGDEVINMFCVIVDSWENLPEIREGLGKWPEVDVEESWLP